MNVDSGASDHEVPCAIAQHPAAWIVEARGGIRVENAFGQTEIFHNLVDIGFAKQGIVIPGANVGLLAAHRYTG